MNERIAQIGKVKPGVLVTVRVPGGHLTGRARWHQGRLCVLRALGTAGIPITAFNLAGVGA